MKSLILASLLAPLNIIHLYVVSAIGKGIIQADWKANIYWILRVFLYLCK